MFVYINENAYWEDGVSYIQDIYLLELGYEYHIRIDMSNRYKLEDGVIKFDIKYMDKIRDKIINKQGVSKYRYYLILRVGGGARVFWDNGPIRLDSDDFTGRYYSVAEWIIKGIIE
jgi:hypothetical protein